MTTWKEIATTVHEANHKWWVDLETGEPKKRNLYEMLALINSEISEAQEGARKDLMDDKLPHRKMEEVEMADTLIRILDFWEGNKIALPLGDFVWSIPTDFPAPANKGESFLIMQYLVCQVAMVPVHSRQCVRALASAVTAILIHCESHGLDLQGAFAEKMEYNRTREDHSIEHRKSENGKKW